MTKQLLCYIIIVGTDLVDSPICLFMSFPTCHLPCVIDATLIFLFIFIHVQMYLKWSKIIIIEGQPVVDTPV